MILTHFNDLEALKKLALLKAGITSVTPSDCGMLSLLIYKKTGYQVSETTLKRMYGFAYSKFQPSGFTINSFAEYCDFDNYESFYKSQRSQEPAIAKIYTDWNNVREQAESISLSTLQTLKHRTGIPFKYTIPRIFINAHMDAYVSSGLVGTAIVSPAGFGKTTALIHWSEDKILNNPNQDIVLFFSSTALASALFGSKNLNEWILSLLGLVPGMSLADMDKEGKPVNARLYLIIDGFDNIFLKTEQFHLLINQFLDLGAGNYDWFRLILTMRSDTWINYRYEFEAPGNCWYTGFETENEWDNVPLFTFKEVHELCKNINPSAIISESEDVIHNFKHPIFFQYYYELFKENFNLDNLDLTSIFELNALFVLNKVYLGAYADQKLHLIRVMVNIMLDNNELFGVPKSQVIDLIKTNKHAYQELLSVGFLREINESTNYIFKSVIQFQNNDFLTFSIANTFLFETNDIFNLSLIQRLNHSFLQSVSKLPVIKWLLIHAIKTGQQQSFYLLTEIELDSNEKHDLVLFLGELMNKEFLPLAKPESLANFFNQDFNTALFDYFFGIELISPEYIETLQTLLRFELPERKKLLVYTALGIAAAISLDLEKLENCIIQIALLSAEIINSFPINPLFCLRAIYDYFKHGNINRVSLKYLTVLSLGSSVKDLQVKKCAANDMLLILSQYTLMLSANSRKVLRLIIRLKDRYNYEVRSDELGEYNYFVTVLEANSFYNLNMPAEVNQRYYKISNNYKKAEDKLTPYMKTLFFSLKIKLLLTNKRFDEIPVIFKELEQFVIESGSKLSMLYTTKLLSEYHIKESFDSSFSENLSFTYHKLITENHLNKNVFIMPEVIRENQNDKTQ